MRYGIQLPVLEKDNRVWLLTKSAWCTVLSADKDQVVLKNDNSGETYQVKREDWRYFVNDLPVRAKGVERTRLSDMIWDVLRTEDHLIETLAKEARYLAARMTELADKLTLGEHQPNSLGEVQSRGADVDRLCGELHQVRETIARLRYLTKEGKD